MKRILCAVAACVLCAKGATAANTFTSWTGLDETDPTDLAKPANWNGGAVPAIDIPTMNAPFGKFSSCLRSRA